MGAPNEENLNANGDGCGNTSSKTKGIKTVYLIRHAESDENRRRHSLNRCFEQISTGAIPSTEDLNASFELLNVPAQVNSDVSEIGAKQIEHMGEVLQDCNFLEKKGVQLVVHSPLLRARQTCLGLLGCAAPAGPQQPLRKPSSVKRVEELDFLVERQPQEIPQDVILKDVAPTSSSFTRRIKQFENWLVQQPEDIIAVVGHSLHFKTMLGVSFKFGNCEVWEAQFDCSKQQQLHQQTTSMSFDDSTASCAPMGSPGSLLLAPIPQAMQEMNNLVFLNRNRQPSVSPWSGLARVYGCQVSR